jgi:hypothetical protein
MAFDKEIILEKKNPTLFGKLGFRRVLWITYGIILKLIWTQTYSYNGQMQDFYLEYSEI